MDNNKTPNGNRMYSRTSNRVVNEKTTSKSGNSGQRGFYGRGIDKATDSKTVPYKIKGKNKLKSNVAPRQSVTPGIRERERYNDVYGRGNLVNESGKNDIINNIKRPNNKGMRLNIPSMSDTEDVKIVKHTSDDKEKDKKSSLVSIVINDGTRKKRSYNEEMAKVVVGVMLIFVGLIATLSYFVQVSSKDLINNSENSHAAAFAKTIKKGNIYDRDLNLIAETKEDSDGKKSYRNYPYKELYAHAIGSSNLGCKLGVEEKYELEMLQTSVGNKYKFINELRGKKSEGDSVKVTLDTDVQKAAYKAMEKYELGAVVAIEPDTGEIITMLSKPTFDPNERDKKAVKEKESLVNRVVNGAYPPGSTFKIVTTLEYLREHDDNISDYSYECTGEMSFDNTKDYKLHCSGNTAHGKEDFKTSFANSCNTSFANIGLSLDMDKYKKLCKDLLIGEKINYMRGTTAYSGNFKLEAGASHRAQTVIGQGKTLMSPFHNALITSAIANGGVLIEPIMVKEVVAASEKVIDRAEKKEKRLMTEKQASILEELMSEVVKSGTAKGKFTSDFYTVSGKTGTAEVGGGKESHAWFVGFAKNDRGKKLAICVFVENGGSGGKIAAPVAKEVFDEYFKKNQ